VGEEKRVKDTDKTTKRLTRAFSIKSQPSPRPLRQPLYQAGQTGLPHACELPGSETTTLTPPGLAGKASFLSKGGDHHPIPEDPLALGHLEFTTGQPLAVTPAS
jgi:hypothetical protein